MAEVKSRYPNGIQMTAFGEKVPDRGLDALRAKIARLEGPPARHSFQAGPKAGSEAESKDGGGAPPRRPVLPLGVKAIDGYLPWGGLPAGALHEVIAGDVSAAATAFALTLAASLAAGEGRGRKGPAPFLWCVNGNVPYGPGLAAFGIEDHQLLVVRGRNDRDVLWAAEEGLGARALAAVFAEVHALDLTASRRLALAARESGVTAFALRPFGTAPAAPGEAGFAGRSPAATAALTRWRVTSAQSLGEASDGGVGTACWRLELLRCRNAMPKVWRVAWRGAAAGRWDLTRNQAWKEEHGRENGGGGETGGLSLATEISDRPDHPGKESGRTYTTTPLEPAANRASGA
jgi:protein ImuA